MPLEPGYAFVLSSPTQESLPPYSPGWRRDENVDVGEKEEEGTGGTEKRRSPWGEWREWAVAYGDAPHVFNTAFDKFWSSSWKKKFVFKEQVIALLLVTVLGVIPLALLGHYSPQGSYYYSSGPFAGIFEDKIMSCGTSFGTPENATVRGVEKMFVLDQTYGRLSFAQAKTIDVFWDIAIGRGVQMIAWWVGYIVFSDALLRAIERHPASFRIFQRIALEGPSLLSLITLVKELWHARSKRTRALFFYIWIATLYIISIPMFLSAMTGYDSTSTPWVSLDDDNNIVPASNLRLSWWAHGTLNNETFGDEGVCLDMNDYSKLNREMDLRERYCDCQLKNGTIVAASKYISRMPYVYYNDPDSACQFDFPGNTKTFKVDSGGYYGGNYYGVIEGERNCNSTFDVTVNGKKYDASKINGTSGYCYGNKGYSYPYLSDRSRCLPDTANPTYQWGFSTMLSGLFVFFHFTWVVSMYIVWQDAHWNSKLVSTGYQMTPLRAAFAMAKAAKRKTGLGEKQLVRANTKELEQELYGSKTTRPTEVEFGIFEEDEEHGEVEVRRRIVRPRDEDEDGYELKERDKDRDKKKSVEVEARNSGEMSDVPLNP